MDLLIILLSYLTGVCSVLIVWIFWPRKNTTKGVIKTKKTLNLSEKFCEVNLPDLSGKWVDNLTHPANDITVLNTDLNRHNEQRMKEEDVVIKIAWEIYGEQFLSRAMTIEECRKVSEKIIKKYCKM